MEQLIEIPRMQIVMAFVATCIEATARLLNTSYKEIYYRMNCVGLIEHKSHHYNPFTCGFPATKSFR